MTFTLPLAIYTLSAFFREIPWDLDKAAQVDGATPWQAFTQDHRPARGAGRVHGAILVFIFAWNDFLFAIALTSTDARADGARRRSRSSPAGRSSRTRPARSPPPRWSSRFPIIIMVLVFQRRIVAGLTAGAVKG